MKLEKIKQNHLLQAAEYIDANGIPENYLENYYWVEISEGKEYPFKYLVRVAYELATGENNLKFESNETYRGYVQKQLGYSMIEFPEWINFFKTSEFDLLERVGGTSYRTKNEDNIKDGRFLKALVKKTKKWAELSVIEDFKIEGNNQWQTGFDFKKYYWKRLYRQGDSGKVFFNLIVTGQEIFYKIDCLGVDKTNLKALCPKMQGYVQQYLDKTNHQPQVITKTKLKDYSWAKLIEETQTFIQSYLGLYDELESLVTNQDLETPDLQANTLNQTAIPNQIRSNQTKQRNFKGADIDWFKKQRTSTHLGKAGEQLVIQIEKEKLIEWGMDKKVIKVVKVKDGRGFDILSFDENGNEIHIEVKTTVGKRNEPFYISANEKAYIKACTEKYKLYRLYNFNLSLNRAYFYELDLAALQQMTFTATNYEVSF